MSGESPTAVVPRVHYDGVPQDPGRGEAKIYIEVTRASNLPAVEPHIGCWSPCNICWVQGQVSYVELTFESQPLATSSVRTKHVSGANPEWKETKVFPLQRATDASLVFDIFSRGVPHDTCIGVVRERVSRLKDGSHRRSINAQWPEATLDFTVHFSIGDEPNEGQRPEPNPTHGEGDHTGQHETPPATRVDVNLMHQPPWARFLSSVPGFDEASTEAGSLFRLWWPLLEKLKIFSEVARVLSQVHPFASMAYNVFAGVCKIVGLQVERDEKIKKLYDSMDQLYNIVHTLEINLDDSEALNIQGDILSRISLQTTECCFFIRTYVSDKSFSLRLAKNAFRSKADERIAHYCEVFAKLKDAFCNKVRCEVRIIVNRVFNQIEQQASMAVLEDMPYARGAALCPLPSAATDWSRTLQDFQGLMCLEGTRVSVLEEIGAWVSCTDGSKPRVLLLKGAVGTGKSAIASTVAYRFAQLHRLGSSFTFGTGTTPPDPSVLIPTLARDLADFDEDFGTSLCNAVRRPKAMRTTQHIPSQFTNHLINPMKDLEVNGPILVVIDALDQCAIRQNPESWRARQEILAILKQRAAELPHYIRILVTSRPDDDINLHLVGLNIQVLELPSALESDGDDKTSDILKYIRSRLAGLKDAMMELDPGWDGMLELRSDGIFQWAAVACNLLLEDASDRRKQYQRLVGINSGARRDDLLDNVYSQTLSRLVPLQDEPRQQYKTVMSLVLATYRPLSRDALNALLRREGKDLDAGDTLRLLGSLLSGVSGAPTELVKPFHSSFREFLTSQQRSGDFFVNLADGHRLLASSCLSVMVRGLKFNICGLESSYLPNAAVPDIRKRVADCISLQLSYAAAFWSRHLAACNDCPFEPMHVDDLQLLLGEKFLFWLEVLSLVETPIPAAVQGVWRLSQFGIWADVYLDREHCVSIADFVADAARFVRTHEFQIETSAPHIYLSALPFAVGTLIHRLYAPYFPNTISFHPSSTHALSVPARIVRHSGAVRCITFVPGDTSIMSSSDDRTINLWDVGTGSRTSVLRLEADTIGVHLSVSQDGTCVAVGTEYGAIYIGNVGDGSILRRIMNAGFEVAQIEFLDDTTIASCANGRLTLWNPSGKLLESQLALPEAKDGEPPIYDGLAVSTGHVVALRADTGALVLWEVSSRKLLSELSTRGPCRDVLNSVGQQTLRQRLMSSTFSRHETWKRFCDGMAGALYAPSPKLGLSVPSGSWITATASSPQGTLIAHACGLPPTGVEDRDNTGQVRVIETASLKVRWNTSVRDAAVVAFSRDGNRLAAGTKSGRIHLWNIEALREHKDIFLPHKSGSCTGVDSDLDLGDLAARPLGIALLENGWVVAPKEYTYSATSHDHDALLFWVPPDFRDVLQLPYRQIIIGLTSERLCLDLTRFVHGSGWAGCYKAEPGMD